MKIVLLGYGKMGREIESLAESKGHEITGRGSRTRPLDAVIIEQSDVAIDFSSPAVVLSNASLVLKCGKPLVIGTTGWYDRMPDLQKLVKEHDGSAVYASNFSIGVQMFFSLTASIAKLADRFEEYDPFIQEIHHRQKADSPSGTALRLGQIVLDHLKRKRRITGDTVNGIIPPDTLHISSVRSGSVPGTHVVGLDGPADTIELKHTARNRSGFANGALIAANWITGKKGLHDFSEIFDEA